jgi:hypothetical protein
MVVVPQDTEARMAVLAKANSKLPCQTGTDQVRDLKQGMVIKWPIVIT